MNTRIFIYIFSLLFTTTLLNAQEPTKKQLEKVDAMVQSQIKGNVPALAVGIVSQGQIVYESYLGYANLEHQTKASNKSRFNIASNAKQFTALMVLDLVGKGKLTLNDDLRSFLPDLYKNIKDPITVLQIINHTSGIRDYCDLMSVQGNAWWRRIGADNKDVLELLSKQETLNFKPGSDYAYSNSGYILLTFIIEKVTGKSFIDYSDSWFKDLGLNHSGYSDNYMQVLPNKAYPYTDWGDGVWQAYPMVTDFNGDGFLYTTLKDQLIWEQTLQSEAANNPIIAQSQRPIDSEAAPFYGFGMEHNTQLGYPSINHTGGTGSYGARFLRFPEQKLAIVVMTSNASIYSEGLALDIAKELLPVSDQVTALVKAMPDTILEKPEASKVVGTYQLENDGTVIKIVNNNGVLSREIKGTNPVELIHEQGNVYAYKTIPELKMVFIPSQGDIGPYDFELYHPTIPARLASRKPKLVIDPSMLAMANGNYSNEELGVGFSLEYDQDAYFNITKGKRTYRGKYVSEGAIAMGDFIIKAQQDASGAVVGFSLNYSRIRDVQFRRVKN